MSETDVEYNMDHTDELPVFELRPALQTDIQKALKAAYGCKAALRIQGNENNPYLLEAYEKANEKVRFFFGKWEGWFHSDHAVRVAVAVPEMMQ